MRLPTLRQRGASMPDSNTNCPALLSLSRLSRLLGFSRQTCYSLLHSEQLPKAVKTINGRRYWTQEQINNFLENKR
jgi:predicted DNA-binding transcriptional regulator AlpA